MLLKTAFLFLQQALLANPNLVQYPIQDIVSPIKNSKYKNLIQRNNIRDIVT